MSTFRLQLLAATFLCAACTAPARIEVRAAPAAPTIAPSATPPPPVVHVHPPSATNLPVVSNAGSQALDLAALPEEQRPAYEVTSQRCSQCHGLERTLRAVASGTAPLTGQAVTDEWIKDYVVEQMRQPNSGITKDDAPQIIWFLRWALALGRPGSEPRASP